MQKLIIALSFFVLNGVFGQEDQKCPLIIVSDSLFKKANYNGFNVMLDNIQSDTLKSRMLFSFKNGLLKFCIGTGPNYIKSQLVTNGVLNTDSKGRTFYFIKLLVVEDNRNQVNALLVFRRLCFDISTFLSSHNVDYIQFYGEQEFIFTK